MKASDILIDLVNLIKAIQEYRIRAERSGVHLVQPKGPQPQYTPNYTLSGPIMWALQKLRDGIGENEITMWNALALGAPAVAAENFNEDGSGAGVVVLTQEANPREDKQDRINKQLYEIVDNLTGRLRKLELDSIGVFESREDITISVGRGPEDRGKTATQVQATTNLDEAGPVPGRPSDDELRAEFDSVKKAFRAAQVKFEAFAGRWASELGGEPETAQDSLECASCGSLKPHAGWECLHCLSRDKRDRGAEDRRIIQETFASHSQLRRRLDRRRDDHGYKTS